MKKVWMLIFVVALMLCACHSTEETEPVTTATVPTEVQISESLETEATEETEGENTLTAEELSQFQSLFDDPMDWYARALTSRYEDPKNADLENMFYCGAGDIPASEAEREYLQSQWIPELFDFDIVRCDTAAMEDALQLVFGMGLEEMNGVGLENMTYYNGAYFRSSSDVLITIVCLDRGIWVDDSTAELYYMSDEPSVGSCCVTMQKQDSRWVILSNVQVD